MDDSTKLGNVAQPGIVYLSSIPKRMNVKHVRQIFSAHGEVGRIFLQPNGKVSTVRKHRGFAEGWIEFSSKRVARHVAAALNNTPVGGKRRNPWYSDLWNVKYLPRFTWGLLNERLTYERAVHKKRLRNEISIAKRETAEFISNSEYVSKRLKRKTNDAGACSKAVSVATCAVDERENYLSNSQTIKTTKKATTSDFVAKLFSGGLQ